MSIDDPFLVVRLLAFVLLLYGVYLALKNSESLARLIRKDAAGLGRSWRVRLR